MQNRPPPQANLNSLTYERRVGLKGEGRAGRSPEELLVNKSSRSRSEPRPSRLRSTSADATSAATNGGREAPTPSKIRGRSSTGISSLLSFDGPTIALPNMVSNDAPSVASVRSVASFEPNTTTTPSVASMNSMEMLDSNAPFIDDETQFWENYDRSSLKSTTSTTNPSSTTTSTTFNLNEFIFPGKLTSRNGVSDVPKFTYALKVRDIETDSHEFAKAFVNSWGRWIEEVWQYFHNLSRSRALTVVSINKIIVKCREWVFRKGSKAHPFAHEIVNLLTQHGLITPGSSHYITSIPMSCKFYRFATAYNYGYPCDVHVGEVACFVQKSFVQAQCAGVLPRNIHSGCGFGERSEGHSLANGGNGDLWRADQVLITDGDRSNLAPPIVETAMARIRLVYLLRGDAVVRGGSVYPLGKNNITSAATPLVAVDSSTKSSSPSSPLAVESSSKLSSSSSASTGQAATIVVQVRLFQLFHILFSNADILFSLLSSFTLIVSLLHM